jgi:hypothetical protein
MFKGKGKAPKKSGGKGRRTYRAWGSKSDSSTTTTDSSTENEEVTNLCFMAKHHNMVGQDGK